jgi:hypothetical protein
VEKYKIKSRKEVPRMPLSKLQTNPVDETDLIEKNDKVRSPMKLRKKRTDEIKFLAMDKSDNEIKNSDGDISDESDKNFYDGDSKEPEFLNKIQYQNEEIKTPVRLKKSTLRKNGRNKPISPIENSNEMEETYDNDANMNKSFIGPPVERLKMKNKDKHKKSFIGECSNSKHIDPLTQTYSSMNNGYLVDSKGDPLESSPINSNLFKSLSKANRDDAPLKVAYSSSSLNMDIIVGLINPGYDCFMNASLQ